VSIERLSGNFRFLIRALASSRPSFSGFGVRSHRVAPLALLAFDPPPKPIRGRLRIASE
jgi:hypothetical protein